MSNVNMLSEFRIAVPSIDDNGEEITTYHYFPLVDHEVYATEEEALNGEIASKVISPYTLQSSLDLNNFVSKIGPDQAYIRNGFYRGKNLGSVFTDEQKLAISSGTFDDMFIGDYWKIDDRKYIIADFNYYLNMYATPIDETLPTVIQNHVTIVPDTSFGYSKMNSTNVTTTGYANCYMKTTMLPTVLTIIENIFGENNILKYPLKTTNSVGTAGVCVSMINLESKIDLLNEVMIYGCFGLTPVYSSTIVTYQRLTSGMKQLSLFMLRSLTTVFTVSGFWLRDIHSGTNFSLCTPKSLMNSWGAINESSIIPSFSLVG